MVYVPFHVIRVNVTAKGLEIIFPFGNQWWRLSWDKVPSRFKHLYVVYLKLLGREIPDYLKEYEVETINVENVSVRIDLDKCEQIPHDYPIGV